MPGLPMNPPVSLPVRAPVRPATRAAASLALLLLLAACATQAPGTVKPAAPGFLFGLIQGLIAPIAFVASFFTDTAVYSVPNNGGWYNFGFLLGLSGWGGGAALR